MVAQALIRPEPRNKLTQEEREEVLAAVNSPAHKSLPPSQIVPTLADEGRYIASESTFYRILREENQQQHRGRSKAPGIQAAQHPLCYRIRIRSGAGI